LKTKDEATLKSIKPKQRINSIEKSKGLGRIAVESIFPTSSIYFVRNMV
jgi:hypothetical protein